MSRPVSTFHAIEPTASQGHLRGLPLLLARLIWIAVSVLALGLFVFAVPFQLERLGKGYLGLRWARNDNGEVVLSPTPEMPAADAGVQSGDILLAVDGVGIRSDTSANELSRLLQLPTQMTLDFRARDGSTHQVLIRRDGRVLDTLGWSLSNYADYVTTLDALLVLIFTSIALFIFWRCSDDWYALLMSLTLILVAVRIPSELTLLSYAEPSWDGVLDFIAFVGTFTLTTALVLFPNGRYVPGWTRVYVFGGFIYALLIVYSTTPLNRSNSGILLNALIETGMGAIAIIAQIIRYYNYSTRTERQQTRWVVWGLAIAFVGQYAYTLPAAVNSTLSDASAPAMRYQIFGQPVSYLALMVAPFTLAISILRYHLWNIDVVIRRTLVYAPLTALLAGLFAAALSLSQLFVPRGGWESDVVTVFSTLLVAAAFTPIRNVLQAFVDARFKEGGQAVQRLQAFGDQVRLRAAPVEIHQVARRLLEEARSAFAAPGGTIELEVEGKQVVHVLGEWNGEAALRVPLLYANHELGELMLGERRDRKKYSREAVEALEKACLMVARAIEEDRLLQV